MKDVATTVQSIVTELLGIEGDRMTPEASFVEDLGADSLDMFEMAMSFESAFDVEISDADVARIVTVQHAIDLILEKKIDMIVDRQREAAAP